MPQLECIVQHAPCPFNAHSHHPCNNCLTAQNNQMQFLSHRSEANSKHTRRYCITKNNSQTSEMHRLKTTPGIIYVKEEQCTIQSTTVPVHSSLRPKITLAYQSTLLLYRTWLTTIAPPTLLYTSPYQHSACTHDQVPYTASRTRAP